MARKKTNMLFNGAISAVTHHKSCACIVAITMNCTCGGMELFLQKRAALEEHRKISNIRK